MELYSGFDVFSICKPCPEYKGGKGQCVYPHEKGVKTGPGTGWPKKPKSGQTCEELAKNLAMFRNSAAPFIPKNEDTITVDVPLFIRLLEWAREEAKADVPLHEITEKALSLKKILTMNDYGALISGTTREFPNKLD